MSTVHRQDRQIVADLPGLQVWAPPPDYIFAMKCLAARVEDRADVATLADMLGVRTFGEASAILLRYYPANGVLPKTRFMLEGLLGPGEQPLCAGGGQPLPGPEWQRPLPAEDRSASAHGTAPACVRPSPAPGYSGELEGHFQPPQCGGPWRPVSRAPAPQPLKRSRPSRSARSSTSCSIDVPIAQLV